MAYKKRDYNNDYPSLTTLLSLLRKPQLENWFKIHTPEYINKESEKAKEIGSQLAEAIQSHIELDRLKVDTQYGEEITNCLKSFMSFKNDYPSIKLCKAEVKLTSKKYKINGTLDSLGEWNELIIWEWKSGNCRTDIKPPIYSEYLWQNAGYINLYNDVNQTNIRKGCVVSFAKDKIAYNMQIVEGEIIEESFKNIILPLRKIWQYQQRKEL